MIDHELGILYTTVKYHPYTNDLFSVIITKQTAQKKYITIHWWAHLLGIIDDK